MRALRYPLVKLLCVASLACWTCAGHAEQDAAPADKVTRNLPDLPSANGAPGHFELDEQKAALGYSTRLEKWAATVDEYAAGDPSLTVDYGTLLGNSFGAGMTVTQRSAHSEVLVNGIFVPMRNLRIQVAGGQLRGSGDASSGNASNAVSQSNYLFGVKRIWGEGTLLSDLGLAAYAVQANSQAAAALQTADTGETALGKQDGYLLNLGLQPSTRSRIELRHEMGRLVYTLDDSLRSEEYLGTNRIKYSQFFDNCVRLQGRYRSSADADRVDVNIARHNWQFNISRAQESSGSDIAFHIGYSLPLGTSGRNTPDCGGRPRAPSLEPIVDAAMRRPSQFPHEPLIRSGFE
jgi:hypothetical protein